MVYTMIYIVFNGMYIFVKNKILSFLSVLCCNMILFVFFSEFCKKKVFKSFFSWGKNVKIEKDFPLSDLLYPAVKKWDQPE